MLFDAFLGQLLPLLMGRREGGLFTQATGLSPRAGERLARQPNGMTALRRIGRERLREHLVGRGFSWEEAAGILAQAPGLADPEGPPTPLSALVALSPGAPLGGYERALAFSVRLDNLSAKLAQARAAGDVDGAREAVRAAGFAAPEWFRDLNESVAVGEDASQWRPWLQARSREALDLPLRLLALRALFQWLAIWDVDFCLEYFRPLEPKPLLPWVAPMFDARAFERPSEGEARRRGLLDSPTKRLLEVSATLLHHLRHRRWPETPPKLTELAAWSGVSERLLTKWGSLERPMPYAKFEALWMAVAEADPRVESRGGPVSPPFPLYLAAKAFEILLLRDGVNEAGGREITIVTLGEELYGQPWAQALAAAKAAGAAIGDGAWPPALDIALPSFPEAAG